MKRYSGPVFLVSVILVPVLTGCQTPLFPSISKKGLDNSSAAKDAYAGQSADADPRALSGHLAEGPSSSSAGGNKRFGSILPVSGRATESTGKETKRLLGEAHAAYAARRYDEARRLYEEVLKLDRTNGSAHHRLAIIADRNRDYGTAERHYQMALQQLPGNADLLSDIGFSYFMQGRYKESEHYLKKALAINRNHTKALYNLGYLYGKQGDAGAAYALFRQAGSEENARALMARLFPQGYETNLSRDKEGRDSRRESDFRERGDFSVSAPPPGRGDFVGERGSPRSTLPGTPSESFRNLQDRMRRAREEAIARRQARNLPADAGAGRVTPWGGPPTSPRDVSFRPHAGGSGPASGAVYGENRRLSEIPPHNGDNFPSTADKRWQAEAPHQPYDPRFSVPRSAPRFSDARYAEPIGPERSQTIGSNRYGPAGSLSDSSGRVPDNRLNEAMRRIDRNHEGSRYQLFPAGGREYGRTRSRGLSASGTGEYGDDERPTPIPRTGGQAGFGNRTGSVSHGYGRPGGSAGGYGPSDAYRSPPASGTPGTYDSSGAYSPSARGGLSRSLGSPYDDDRRSPRPDSSGAVPGTSRSLTFPAGGQPPSSGRPPGRDRLLWPPEGDDASALPPNDLRSSGFRAPQSPAGGYASPSAWGDNAPRTLSGRNASLDERHRDALRLGHNTGTGVLFPVPSGSVSRNRMVNQPGEASLPYRASSVSPDRNSSVFTSKVRNLPSVRNIPYAPDSRTLAESPHIRRADSENAYRADTRYGPPSSRREWPVSPTSQPGSFGSGTRAYTAAYPGNLPAASLNPADAAPHGLHNSGNVPAETPVDGGTSGVFRRPAGRPVSSYSFSPAAADNRRFSEHRQNMANGTYTAGGYDDDGTRGQADSLRIIPRR